MNMYFIALVAPEEINRQVVKWKSWMKERYSCSAALRSPAHITLVPPFWMKPEPEASLMTSLDEFSATQTGFIIQLKNFSHFKDKVLFVDVIPDDRLKGLQTGLHSFLTGKGEYPLKKEDRPFHPHVTLATRDLHKRDFYEAWEHFKEKKYEKEWIVQGIALLRHNKKNWDVIKASQFA
ncbi:MAG: 2'-5' RNA ligase family protein [Bacteroidota bacterium]|nr:2'-5' RNA ligase family protein [Bacteroidota bacterium]